MTEVHTGDHVKITLEGRVTRVTNAFFEVDYVHSFSSLEAHKNNLTVEVTDPTQVWTDGDVVQMLNWRGPGFMRVRFDGAWYSGNQKLVNTDLFMSQLVAQDKARPLVQQSTFLFM